MLHTQHGEKLKNKRKELGLSRNKLARLMTKEGLRFSSRKLRDIENGHRPLHVVELTVLTKIFGLDSTDFLFEDEGAGLASLFNQENLTNEDVHFLEDFEMMVSAFIKQEEVYNTL